jgi:hypothetical protein
MMAAPISAAPAAPVPDFSGIWWHPSLPGPEPLASGPTTVTNRARANGSSDYSKLVGDYTNPILKPAAAEIVKKHGELSEAGVVYPSPANQCWPEPVPFIYKNFALQLLQEPNQITMLYEQDHEVRRIRMNQSHPAKLTPSWYGDSVGHYEGDTLVIDTVGQKSGPFAMLDLYGTPYTKALHVVERYRLIDYEDAKEGLDRDAKENFRAGAGNIDRNYRGKHLHALVGDGNLWARQYRMAGDCLRRKSACLLQQGRGGPDRGQTGLLGGYFRQLYCRDGRFPFLSRSVPKALISDTDCSN